MAVIAVASTKGGPGKTMLSTVLAAGAATDGLAVVAIDADPTATLHRWVTTAYEGAPFACVVETEEAALAHAIARHRDTADLVVVDTAGFGNRAASVAMTSADFVLVPMQPDEADLTEAERTLKLASGLAAAARREIQARVLYNRLRAATTLTRHVLKESAHLPRLEAALSDLTAYGEMRFQGALPRKGKAADEIAALFAELRALGWVPAVRQAA